MKLKVKNKRTGVIYTSDMSDSNKHVITEINFCTSYTQVSVQDEIISNGKTLFPVHDIILKAIGTESNWVDLIATQNDDDGEWVE